MTNQERKARRKLDHAFEYLRPRMVGNSCDVKLDNGEYVPRIPLNAESEAGSILARAMTIVVHEANGLKWHVDALGRPA